MRKKFIVAGVSAAALVFATISPAFADDHGYRHHRGDHDRYDDDYDRNNDYYNNHDDSDNRYNYNNGYGRYQKRKRSNDNGTALGIGLGVVGLALVLGAMSSGNKNKNRNQQRDSNSWYRGDANRNEDGNWRNPDGNIAYSGNYKQFSANDCLETREYQSRVTVGGRNREAYGTSCLMQSGQWVQGQPQLVPEGR